MRIKIQESNVNHGLVEYKIEGNDLSYWASKTEWEVYEAEQVLLTAGADRKMVERFAAAIRAETNESNAYDEQE